MKLMSAVAGCSCAIFADGLDCQLICVLKFSELFVEAGHGVQREGPLSWEARIQNTDCSNFLCHLFLFVCGR